MRTTAPLTAMVQARMPIPNSAACPSPDSLVAFLAAAQPAGDSSIRSHIDECDACLRVFAALASEEFASRGIRTETANRNEELAPGESVGRLIVLHTVGVGGMGHVYAAYDPRLDRKVALKLMQEAGEDANASLLREARLIAKLEHPNIVTVYDVGTHGDAVYLAMEFVQGPSLRAHLRDKPLAEVRSFFADVAGGLAEAHRQGILHRDVKPANILVGLDGRARLADFGLAGRKTVTGRVGTPAYMAPEQEAGTASAASDQFSLCLTLLEVLTGERVSAGHALPNSVPEEVRTILSTGMRPKAEERFSDMEALRRALLPKPPPRRLWPIAAGLIAALAAGAGAYAWAGGEREEACAGAERHLAAVWNSESQAALATRFANASEYGRELWERTKPDLEGYHASWIATHRDVCEATSVRKERSAAQMEASMNCLERHRLSFQGLLRALAAAPGDNLSKVAEARALLEDPARCRISSHLPPVPDNPQTREAVAEVRGRLAEWNASAAMGQVPEATVALEGMASEARQLGYLPLQAEVYADLGTVLSKEAKVEGAREAYREAIRLGTESHHDDLVAKAWLDLAWLEGYHHEEYEAAEQALEAGAAFTKRLGEPVARAVQHKRTRGWLLLRKGKASEALAHFKDALALAEGEARSERDAALLESDIGVAYMRLGTLDLAAAFTKKAMLRSTERLGARHPDVLTMRFNYAGIVREQGNLELAISEALAVLEGFRTALPESPSYQGMVLTNLATMYADQEDWSRAEDTYHEAIRTNRLVGGEAGSSTLATSLHGLATVVQRDDARLGEAESLHRESLAMKESLLGAEHPSVAVGLSGLADLLMAQKRPREAAESLRRGLAILRAAYGESHPHTEYLRGQLAEIQEK